MYGSIYPVSWWGETNEPNGWGSIYPFNAGGSILTADITTITADTDRFNADNGDSTQTQVTPLTGTLLSTGFTNGSLIMRFYSDVDHTFLTAGQSLRGIAIVNGPGSALISLNQAIQISGWFSENTSMTIDTWYPVASKFKVIETEADPDTVRHNMTDITGAQVKYILSPVSGYDYAILIKGGTSSPQFPLNGGAQILTVGEAWLDRDIIKYT